MPEILNAELTRIEMLSDLLSEEPKNNARPIAAQSTGKHTILAIII